MGLSEDLNLMIVGNSLVLHKNLFVKSWRQRSSFSFQIVIQFSQVNLIMIIVIHPKLISFQPRTRLDNFVLTLLTTLHSRFEQKMKEKSQKHLTFQSTTYFCCCQSVCILCFYVLSFLIPSVLNLKLTKIYNIEMSIVLKFFAYLLTFRRIEFFQCSDNEMPNKKKLQGILCQKIVISH